MLGARASTLFVHLIFCICAASASVTSTGGSVTKRFDQSTEQAKHLSPPPVDDGIAKHADLQSRRFARSLQPRNDYVFKDANLQRAAAKGAQLIEQLEKTISSKQLDQGSKRPLQERGYKVTFRKQAPKRLPPSPYYLDRFASLDKGTWNYTLVYRDGTLSDKDQGIVETTSDPDQGTMVVSISWNKDLDVAEDENVQLKTPKVYWSDMTMDIWRQVAGSSRKKGLRYIVRDSILKMPTSDRQKIIYDTKPAMDEVMKIMKFDANKLPATLVLNHKAQAKSPVETAAFQLMAAQTHVSRVLLMLTDHHKEIGDLQIAKLHLIKEKRADGVGYYMVIELCPMDMDHPGRCKKRRAGRI